MLNARRIFRLEKWSGKYIFRQAKEQMAYQLKDRRLLEIKPGALPQFSTVDATRTAHSVLEFISKSVRNNV